MSEYVDIGRVEFAVTYRCNSRCRHCCVEMEKRRAEPAVIDRHLAVDIIHSVCEVYRPSSLMAFGGEPLVYPELVCALHRAAATTGIPRREIITNAGIPRSEGPARDVAFQLAESGVNYISISVDVFHQEHIPLTVVERNVRYYHEAGITDLAWNPCWVVSTQDDNEYNKRTNEVLSALRQLPVKTGSGNLLQPDGRARESLTSYLPARVPTPGGSCEDAPFGVKLDSIDCITVVPSGDIVICSEWSIGNAADEGIVEILERYNPRCIPEAAAILDGGIAALIELCRARGIEPESDGYYSICDMCTSLRLADTKKRSVLR